MEEESEGMCVLTVTSLIGGTCYHSNGANQFQDCQAASQNFPASWYYVLCRGPSRFSANSKVTNWANSGRNQSAGSGVDTCTPSAHRTSARYRATQRRSKNRPIVEIPFGKATNCAAELGEVRCTKTESA